MQNRFDLLMGLCRCEEHAQNYQPKKDKHRKKYFIPGKLISEFLLCGACMQAGKANHGGLIVSEESLEEGVVVFRAHAAYELNDNLKKSVKLIWPK